MTAPSRTDGTSRPDRRTRVRAGRAALNNTDWTHRSNGFTVLVFGMLGQFVVAFPAAALGASAEGLGYLAATLGAVLAFVMLPRGIEAVGKPSHWAIVSGRAASRGDHFSVEERRRAVVAVGVSVALVALAAGLLAAGATHGVMACAAATGIAGYVWVVAAYVRRRRARRRRPVSRLSAEA